MLLTDEYDNGTHGEDRMLTSDEMADTMDRCRVCDEIAQGAETDAGHFICDDCTPEFDALMATYDTRGWSDGDRLCGRCGDFDFVIGDESLCSRCYDTENEQEVIAEMRGPYSQPGHIPTYREIATVFAVVVMLATLAVAGGR